MIKQFATSETAGKAFKLVQSLQSHLVATLDQLPPKVSESRFKPTEWFRENGRYGGGTRFSSSDEVIFNRASVNVSQVQYESEPKRALASASAISSIIHLRNPHAPSIHLHISWTEMKDGKGYWRMMADLNPSIPIEKDCRAFDLALREIMPPELYHTGVEQGAKYFYIPSLKRHRGVIHFYLEEFNSGNFEIDLKLAERFGVNIIAIYAAILVEHMNAAKPINALERQKQLDYHSLYFLQVLTLDRGTTSGLLVHADNDVGTLGSLPEKVNKSLLRSYLAELPPLQKILFESLLNSLEGEAVSVINDSVKSELAQKIRDFYKIYPEAQELLARADKLPPPQQNHQAPVSP